jgi:hypothetical protein
MLCSVGIVNCVISYMPKTLAIRRYFNHLVRPVVPLPLPLGIPLAMPLTLGIPPPRDGAPPLPRVVRFGAGVENFEDGFELAGGLSTKEVSVVLDDRLN